MMRSAELTYISEGPKRERGRDGRREKGSAGGAVAGVNRAGGSGQNTVEQVDRVSGIEEVDQKAAPPRL
jgi:hypothetical protein